VHIYAHVVHFDLSVGNLYSLPAFYNVGLLGLFARS